MSRAPGARAPRWRLVLGAVAAMAGLLAGAGCSSPTTSADPAPGPSLSAAVPTRMPFVDALIATTTASAASTTPPVTPSVTTSPTAPASTAPARTTSPARTTAAAAPAATGRIRPGVVYTGPATLNGPGNGAGNCLFDAVSDPPVPVVAMNELDYDNARACGAYLNVTGPGGTEMVVVTDRCPECVPGQLDMSTQAFDPISGGSIGRIDKITWRLASPAGLGDVQFKVKEQSSQYWLSLQVRNHRNPIASLAIQVNGSWVTVPRQMYNYFEAEGFGAGPYTVRITDVYGQQLVDTVRLAPGAVQTTSSQFAQH